MNERFLLLERSIERDLEAIERLYTAMGTGHLADDASEEELIVAAYRLHNLYNAFESIFQNIAVTFENTLDDAARWHAQLLQRMRLDVMPVRPAVIDETAYDALDELRRFRHLFRYAYDVELDPQRLRLVLRKAMQLKAIYRPQFQRFLDFLRTLRSDG
ncbi:MAG: hypothetical protein H8D78_03525 [Chloroflexi bacterium]|nr:hypothetical protein [Chloroflexota bacterium]